MSGTIIIGAQWGDEGKGKIIDVLAAKAELVVRFQGGANAGHTIVANGKKTVLHLIPSGILHPSATCVMGPGLVIDIPGLIEEIEMVKAAGFLQNPKQLLISDLATLILPSHKSLDGAREKALKEMKIGTTGKGIGPAYEDRASRRALLFADIFDHSTLKSKLIQNLLEKNCLLTREYESLAIDVEPLYEDLCRWSKALEPYRCKDTSHVIYKAHKGGKVVLFEGAQGSMLDNLHGTYPYVTSSSTLSGSACIGAGVPPNMFTSIIGITKAYSTRVGSGPFPSELKNEIGDRIRKEGHEYGATTGRPRRCGWFDLVQMKYSIRLNGFTSIALMKLDVLSDHKEIGVCTAYKIGNEILHDYPTSPYELEKAEPIIQYLPGWTEDLTKVTALKDLPRNTTSYIDFISNQLGTPIDILSVGPGREQTLWIKPLFQ